MFIASDGVLLNAVEWGRPDAPAFVAHGGWVGNWELWQEPFRLMQSRWRCLAYDHRGSGSTRVAPDEISPQSLVEDLLTVLDSSGVQRCVLAGESLGALTCMAFALEHPQRVAGLILVDGVPQGGGPGAEMLAAGSRSDFPATVQWFVDACVPEPDSEHIRYWGRQVLLRADPEAAARILEVHAAPVVAPEAERITAPTLILHGESDVIVPLAAARALADRIPDAVLVTLPDAGHVPTLTRPAEVVGAIEEWWGGRAV